MIQIAKIDDTIKNGLECGYYLNHLKKMMQLRLFDDTIIPYGKIN